MYRRMLVGITILVLPWAAHAGYGAGRVGQVLVGRQGDHVYIELLNSSHTDWPCSSTHPNGFRYAFLLSWAGAKAMLSTVLTAQATGKQIQLVGYGSCTIDSTLEDVHYVVLQPT